MENINQTPREQMMESGDIAMVRNIQESQDCVQAQRDKHLNISKELKEKITTELIELYKDQELKDLALQDMMNACSGHAVGGKRRSYNVAFRKYESELKRLGWDLMNGDDKSQDEWRKVTWYLNEKYPSTRFDEDEY